MLSRGETVAKQRKTYSREFKIEAVRLVETSGKSATEIERELGIAWQEVEIQ